MDSCYKRYKKYLSVSKSNQEVTNTKYIKREKVIPMPRINYFTVRKNKVKKYTFQQDKSISSNSTDTELMYKLKRKSRSPIYTNNGLVNILKNNIKESFDPKQKNDSIDLGGELLAANEFAANEPHISDIFKNNPLRKHLIFSLKRMERPLVEPCRPKSVSTLSMVMNGLFKRNHKRQQSNAQSKENSIEIISKVKITTDMRTSKLKIIKAKTNENYLKEKCMEMIKAMETKGSNKFCNTKQPPKKDSEILIEIEENKSIFRRRPNLDNIVVNFSDRMGILGRNLAM